MSPLLAILLSYLGGPLLSAADEPPPVIAIEAQYPIEIDGNLDDAAWQSAQVLTDFHQVEPLEFAAPSEMTQIRIMFDQRYLYVGLSLSQQYTPITAQQLVQGRTIVGDDRVTLLIDPFRSGRSGYAFSVNPNGIRDQAIIENGDDFNDDWEDIWYAEVVRQDDRWSAEMAIPFTSIGFPPGAAAWHFNFQRIVAAANERIAWSSADRRVDLTTSRSVAGFSDVRPGAGLNVIASGTASWRRNHEIDHDKVQLEPSFDVFYKWTPGLTAAVTINTDFSVAEVDEREVNLTRFDLFFPEKRDFFLQDANIFEFGGIEENGQPYFSRRIGLSTEGDPLDIRVGAKLSGRHGRYRMGFLGIQQDAQQGSDRETLLVGRMQAEISEETALGAIVTSGNPITGQSDRLVGLDYRFQTDEILGEQELETFIWWQRLDQRHTREDHAAYGMSIAWPNDTIDAIVAYTQIDDGFAPPLGFVNRDGIRHYRGEFAYRLRPENSLLRTVDFSLEGNWVDDLSGRLASREIEIKPLNIRNQAGDQLEIDWTSTFERLDQAFEVVDDIEILAGRYRFERRSVEFESADHRHWVFGAQYEWGSFFDGDLVAWESTFSVRPNKHIALGLEYEENRLDLPQGQQTTRLGRLSASYAFNSRWSWTNLIQYDSESRELGVNARLRWVPTPGQEGYIVVNHGQLRDERGRFQPLQSDLALKFSYTFRF